MSTCSVNGQCKHTCCITMASIVIQKRKIIFPILIFIFNYHRRKCVYIYYFVIIISIKIARFDYLNDCLFWSGSLPGLHFKHPLSEINAGHTQSSIQTSVGIQSCWNFPVIHLNIHWPTFMLHFPLSKIKHLLSYIHVGIFHLQICVSHKINNCNVDVVQQLYTHLYNNIWRTDKNMACHIQYVRNVVAS